MNTEEKSKKSSKIFISHSADNTETALILVDLLDFLGIKKIFCSSAYGYEVFAGEGIYHFQPEIAFLY